MKKSSNSHRQRFGNSQKISVYSPYNAYRWPVCQRMWWWASGCPSRTYSPIQISRYSLFNREIIHTYQDPTWRPGVLYISPTTDPSMSSESWRIMLLTQGYNKLWGEGKGAVILPINGFSSRQETEERGTHEEIWWDRSLDVLYMNYSRCFWCFLCRMLVM